MTLLSLSSIIVFSFHTTRTQADLRQAACPHRNHTAGVGETWPSRLSLAFSLPPLLYEDTPVMCVLAKLPHILLGD